MKPLIFFSGIGLFFLILTILFAYLLQKYQIMCQLEREGKIVRNFERGQHFFTRMIVVLWIAIFVFLYVFFKS